MSKLFAVAALAAASVAMSACAGLPGANNVGSQVLSNLQGCDRHYQGAIGAGVSGSFQIDCKAVAPAGTVPAAGASAPAAVTPAPATP